ncbi:unnamed protein product [Schistosoma bovis]|nr:unnamed protein product [Schistosoma bovis]
MVLFRSLHFTRSPTAKGFHVLLCCSAFFVSDICFFSTFLIASLLSFLNLVVVHFCCCGQVLLCIGSRGCLPYMSKKGDFLVVPCVEERCASKINGNSFSQFPPFDANHSFNVRLFLSVHWAVKLRRQPLRDCLPCGLPASTVQAVIHRLRPASQQRPQHHQLRLRLLHSHQLRHGLKLLQEAQHISVLKLLRPWDLHPQWRQRHQM